MMLADLQAALANLHLLRPTWLWALLALPLLAWGWHARRRRQSVWRGAVDAHLLPHLIEKTTLARGSVAPWLASIGYVLAVLALAGPSWQRDPQPLLQSDAPLVIALDLSSATLANDLPPSRLLQARAKIATLLLERAGGQVGLVAFADDAYTVAPITEDAANIALFLDSLTPDVMPVDGSNAARAIEQATALMTQAGFSGGDVLVLTDHADTAARAAAAEAARTGFRVSALGLGSDSGATYRTDDGRFQTAQLDAGSLRALASAGDGRYAALGIGDDDLRSLGVLQTRDAEATAQERGQTAAVWRDGGFWLLPPLMLLALLAFRRGGVLAMLLVCALLPLPQVHAQVRAPDDGDGAGGGSVDRSSATRSDATLWRRADQVDYGRSRAGVDAYRSKDFAAAAERFKTLPGADADYNRGNALASAGKYEEAIAAYDDALRQQPGMADAIANRKAVADALKRKPPPSPKSDSRGDQKQDDSGKPKDGQPPPPGGEQPKPGDGQSPSSPGAKPGNKDPKDGKPGDDISPQDNPDSSAKPPQADDAAKSKAQREADAAQRERMQEALKKRNPQGQTRDEKGAPVDAEAPPGETAAQREQRQANAAWLKRVPDDPGGLLRAKFRLEYERRQQTGER